MTTFQLRVSAIVLCAALATTAAAGCASRRHVRDDFGEHTRTFFERQRVDERAATGSPGGLDSEEAAIIHARYRHDLAGPEQPAGEEQPRVLIVEDPRDAR